ncbi:MAG TPA: PAS domain-containing protein [Actinomycetota bacterium]|nr:PAS domain-containing protein [Actinomycetota bacterium]
MGRRTQRSRRTRGLWDLLVILLAVFMLLWLAAATDVLENGLDWIHQRAADSEDELFLGLLLAATGFAAFAGRRWAAAHREHTARERAETRYRRLVEQMPAVVYTWDPSSRPGTSPTPYVSPQVERILGFPAEELRADPQLWVRRIHPDDRAAVLAATARAQHEGEPLAIEYRHVKEDGTVVWIRDEAVVVERDAHGGPTLAQGLLYDITQRREAEDSARETEARYRALVEQVPAVTYTRDTRGGQGSASAPYVSPQIEHLLGYPAEDWSTDPDLWREAIHPDDRDRVLADWETAVRTRGVFRSEYRVLARDGHPVWIRDEAVPVTRVGTSRRYQGVMYDITERKHAEEQLLQALASRKEAEEQARVAEERYRRLVETISAVIYIDRVDDASTTLYVSPQIEEMFGYAVEDWMEDPNMWHRNLHPSDLDRVLAAVEDHHAHGAPLDAEYRFRAGDGSWRWVRDQATIVRDEQDAPTLSQGLMSDITALKEAQERLRETEARYRAIVEHVPAAIYVDRPDGSMRSVYVSPQIERILGVSPQAYIDDPELWLELIDPADRDEIRRAYLDAVEDGRSWVGEYLVHTPDGRDVWVHDETTFVADGGGKPLFLQGVLYDITERKLAERALRESERREREAAENLRTLDEMKNTFLAAVSHELRSPLTSILGLAATLEKMREPGDEDGDLLARLAANARKLDRLLRDLLDIDRLNRGIVTPNYRSVDLGRLVRRTVDNLDLLGERRVLVEAKRVRIEADPPKVERIVENLIANAARHTRPEITIWVRVWSQPDGAVIAVEDAGPGVPEALQRAIFEPFRQGPTASPHSPGTGIGLSLVSMFAELHGGRAWVQDREGGGASFRVFLPRRAARTGSEGLDAAPEATAEAG